MQFGVHKYYQTSDAFRACNKGFAQFAMRTEQIGFPCRGVNPSLVNYDLRAVRQTNTLNFRREHPVVFKLIVICMHVHRLTQLFLFVFILATGFGLPDRLQALV